MLCFKLLSSWIGERVGHSQSASTHFSSSQWILETSFQSGWSYWLSPSSLITLLKSFSLKNIKKATQFVLLSRVEVIGNNSQDSHPFGYRKSEGLFHWSSEICFLPWSWSFKVYYIPLSSFPCLLALGRILSLIFTNIYISWLWRTFSSSVFSSHHRPHSFVH